MNFKGSITKRLTLIIVLVTLLTGVLGYGSFLFWYMNNQYDRALNLSKTVGLVLGQDIAKLILLNDVSASADISSSLSSFSNLNSMVLYKLDGKPILQYSKNNKSFVADALPKNKKELIIEKNLLTLYIKAEYKKSHLGFVQLKFEIESLINIFIKNIQALLFIFIFSLVISIVLAIFFARKFTEPILKLVSFLEKVDSSESLNRRINIENQNNEYGKLYQEVNTMLNRIQQSHDKLKIAAATFQTQSGILIANKDEEILQVNKAFTKITGYKPEDTIGKKPNILQSGLHSKEFYKQMSESLKTNGVWSGEINNRHKNGKIVNEYLTIHTVLDESNELKYYVASFIDLTTQKKTEAKLIEKENQLVQKTKMAIMGEMIENIAHQWRQPLSAISTVSTGLILKKELDMVTDKEEEISDLKRVNDIVLYLSNTINDFRSFFKPDKEEKFFNAKDSYSKVFNIISSKFSTLNINVVENLEDVQIKGLENELMQVILNILNNAKDALCENENIERKLIFVKIYKKRSDLVFTITDSAGGIPKENINKIFDPYFTTKDSDGTGIGLNMSKEIIEKHMSGKLKVRNLNFIYEESNYKGACFIIKLPLKD